ncbi:PLP-dependent aminotransferase family protein (plasmid) [Pseudomonas luteola]|uniref:MocR-like pyridoxine biosynthesis transcription factor PdxR n=1 Tax=Pseudomonas luteola TaxID=47886 RepID=UPI00388E0960
MANPIVQLDRSQITPLFLQIYQRFRQAIAEGRLKPGDRVPPMRNLATELNLARGTIEAAYQMLISEGYLLPRGPAGTIVSPQLAHQRPRSLAAAAPSVLPAQQGGPRGFLPFQMGMPALDAFPQSIWARLLNRRQREDGTATLIYPDPQGYLALREAIAAYLGVSRGIACTPEQVFICPGYRTALARICQVLMLPGEPWWFEDPGYFHAKDCLLASGATLAPIPVDTEGLDVEVGLRQRPDARFALVTPSHQSPLGVSLSLPRRLALLDWANRQQAWVVEDDYDSEYRYVSRPLPALKSLDDGGRVLYIGSFSKVLFPGLRLAYLVLPQAVQAQFLAETIHRPHDCPYLLQATLTDFMTQGHFSRHLRKMRNLYAQRREYLCQALKEVFGKQLRVDLQAGGMHLLAFLAAGETDKVWADRALKAGLSIQALSDWRQSGAGEQGIMLGFTNVASPTQAQRLAERLRTAVQG